MNGISTLGARLRAATGVAGTLAVSFDAFEVIRSAARSCEDRSTGLLPAFLLAAGAAVEGRNAVVAAPSLPPADRDAAGSGVPSLGVDAAVAADALAAVAGLLAGSLSDAAALASAPGDVAACAIAAEAAAEIHRLLARGYDDRPVR